MKGRVIMRFVGNRQEPEESPVASYPFLLLSQLSKEGQEVEEFYWEQFRRQTAFLLGVPPSLVEREKFWTETEVWT